MLPLEWRMNKPEQHRSVGSESGGRGGGGAADCATAPRSWVCEAPKQLHSKWCSRHGMDLWVDIYHCKVLSLKSRTFNKHSCHVRSTAGLSWRAEASRGAAYCGRSCCHEFVTGTFLEFVVNSDVRLIITRVLTHGSNANQGRVHGGWGSEHETFLWTATSPRIDSIYHLGCIREARNLLFACPSTCFHNKHIHFLEERITYPMRKRVWRYGGEKTASKCPHTCSKKNVKETTQKSENAALFSSALGSGTNGDNQNFSGRLDGMSCLVCGN